jgi:hypothetical protein
MLDWKKVTDEKHPENWGSYVVMGNFNSFHV